MCMMKKAGDRERERDVGEMWGERERERCGERERERGGPKG